MKPFSPEAEKVSQIYDYLTAPTSGLPDHSDVTFVFGRKSPELITATAEAAAVSGYLVVSGNVGKDSGDLPETGIPESSYVIDGLGAIMLNNVLRETKAVNGIEAAKYGVQIIGRNLCLKSLDTLVVVMHSTQTRRLGGIMAMQAKRAGLGINQLIHYPTGYSFDPSSRYDQHEAASELVMINNYASGHRPNLELPDDLPMELVEYAGALREYHAGQFKNEGIRNPSTANDTDRSKSPIQTILFNATPGASMPLRLWAYSTNFTRLGRAAARQKIVPRLPQITRART